MLAHLILVQQKAYELMSEHGLLDEGWTFRISNTKRFVGRCFYQRKIIEYSKWFLESPPEEIRDVLLHEIAHALAGSAAGHGPEWKVVAARIGARPERCTNRAVSKAKPNYVLACPECDRQWPRFRLRQRTHLMRCPYCRVRIEVRSAIPAN